MQGTFGMTGLGPAGAGLASLVVAIGMGGSVTAYLFLSRSFDGYPAPPDTERVLDPVELLRFGRSAGLMGAGAVAETGVFLGSTLLVGAVAAPMLVAHTLAFRVVGASYLILAAIGQATTIRTAYLASRRSPREGHARAAIASCGSALMILLAALFILGAKEVARLAAATIGSADARLVTATTGLLPLAGGALALAVPVHLACAVLRARGRPLAALAVMADRGPQRRRGGHHAILDDDRPDPRAVRRGAHL
jgi:Na+-driven multidrug efflux pump